MAELHIIGQILHALNFEEPNLFCKWSIQFGSNWKPIEGHIEGQTATCRARFDGHLSFVHPIDVHLSCRGIQGWPKIHVEIYAVVCTISFLSVLASHTFPFNQAFTESKFALGKLLLPRSSRHCTINSTLEDLQLLRVIWFTAETRDTNYRLNRLGKLSST